MCGICGIINLKENRVERGIVETMCDQLIHRGPDDSGCYYDDFVALGHRRLSIIDLESGQQPIFNEDKSIALIFNGEIYNFRELRKELEKKQHSFRTHTDSEVIVHLYEEFGVDCLSKLNGMFAFAIWDNNNRRLFLARDRVGIKPLVYYYDDNNFMFASEIKSLVASGLANKKLDLEALHLYFTFGYIPAPWTIYHKIRKLPPAHYLVVESGEVIIKRYWSISTYRCQLSLNEAEEHLLYLLRESVRGHMISDVPVGAFLSGGIDSSTIVALMSEISDRPVTTCTVGYEDNKFYDESKYAQQVADVVGTEHQTYYLSKNDLLNVTPTAISKLGEPFADPSLIPTYAVSQKMRTIAKVALSGDGADELFAGYNKYLGEYWYRYFSFIPSPITEYLIKPVVDGLPAIRTNTVTETIRKTKRFLAGLGHDYMQRHYQWMEIFSKDLRRELIQVRPEESNIGETIIKNIFNESIITNGSDITNRLLEVDFKFILPNDMLTKVDLASMWNSLEVRVPFLDHRIVEFAFNLKGNYKLNGRNRKVILKRAIKKLLPENILNRTKHAFDIPIGEWFKNELQSTFLNTVNELDIRNTGILNYKAIQSLYDKHRHNYEDHTRPLWSIFLFQSWLNANEIHL